MIHYGRGVVTGGLPDPEDEAAKAKVESFLVDLGETRLPQIAVEAGFTPAQWGDVEQLASRFDRYGLE